MRVLQINTTVNTTSTGRITEDIGRTLIENGHESYIAYSKIGPAGSTSKLVKIGNRFDNYCHGLKTRLLDRHGFGSVRATRKLIREIEKINPDAIGLHNLHGYYLNVEILFNYLKKAQKPVIWTFHDCWPFTGHCAYFDFVNCERWIKGCYDCPLKTVYPASYGLDCSSWNYKKKRTLFTGINNLTIVSPSRWLAGLVKQSFLNEYPVNVIPNGVNLDVFKTVKKDDVKRKYKLKGMYLILGVASVWDRRKGLDDFIELSGNLSQDYQIALIGLDKNQIRELPGQITGIERTEDVNELAALYSAADVFVNPTWVDNFPTTNLEALACGTPVITYNTGGSPETIDDDIGRVVEKGDINGLKKSIDSLMKTDLARRSQKCRSRAELLYNKNDRFQDYMNLFKNKLTGENVETVGLPEIHSKN